MQMNKETKNIISILVLTVIILGGVYFATVKSGSQKNNSIDQQTLVREDSYKLGNGEITIVEFGDYQCPPCKTAQEIMKTISADYSGKITFVFRNFPLPLHANSNIAALAAEAANAQGKFWEMHDKLYETQTEWSNLENPLDAFVGYAQSISLDTEKFKQDVENKTYQNKIDRDLQDGTTISVLGTPSFFLNGVAVSDYTLANMKSIIDKTLKK